MGLVRVARERGDALGGRLAGAGVDRWPMPGDSSGDNHGDNQHTSQQRGPGGRFSGENTLAVGHTGHGSISLAIRQKYNQILIRACSEDDWREITKKAVQDAKMGNKGARDWLSKWIMPATPSQIVDNRSVKFDLTQLSSEQLEQFVALAALANSGDDRGRTTKA